MTSQSGKRHKFKGVENFLRRVAFNLGNSPSQTEVKIISCIPIDVTDLQQRIVTLERQLEEAKVAARVSSKEHCSKVLTSVNPALYSQKFTRNLKGSYDCIYDSLGVQQTTSCPHRKKYAHSQSCSDEHHSPYVTEPQQQRPVFTRSSYSEISHWHPKASSKYTDRRRNIKQKQPNTQYIYYAQPQQESPFTKFRSPYKKDKQTSKKRNKTIHQSYLSDIVRKQYCGEVYDNRSEISAPVCRDKNMHLPTVVCDTESCFVVPVYPTANDQSMMKRTYRDLLNSSPRSLFCENDKNIDMFYDSSFYDIVPVKETSAMDKDSTKELKIDKNRIAKSAFHYSPDNSRKNPLHKSYIINYENPGTNCSKNMRLNSRKETMRKLYTPKNRLNNDTAKTRSVECGNVYPKPLQELRSSKLIERETTSKLKDAWCLTSTVNNTECQADLIPKENTTIEKLSDKTEDTLNQIKIMLQCVLTQVKTNSIRKSESGGSSKRDAFVQKESSQSNVPGGSRFLSSITYSPFNMNPFMQTYSHLAAFTYPSFPTHIPNIPVIQAPIPYLTCNSFTSNNKPNVNLNAAATNTEDAERSNETKKLIKEIYKSVYLNIDDISKDTSKTSYEEINNYKFQTYTPQRDPIINEFIDIDSTTDNFYNKNANIRTAITSSKIKPLVKPLLRSNIEQELFVSRSVTESEKQNYITDEIEERNENRQATDTENYENERLEALNNLSDQRIAKNFNTESESDVGTINITTKNNPKTGLLGKVAKFFKSRRKRVKQVHTVVNTETSDEDTLTDDDDEDGDEDDEYQTVYSEETAVPERYRRHKIVDEIRRQHRDKKKPGIHFTYKPRIKTPYMEQEERRLWNEHLTFHDESPVQHSSERPYRHKHSPSNPHSAYFRNYEARSALVDYKEFPVPMPGQPLTEPVMPNAQYIPQISQPYTYQPEMIPNQMHKKRKGLARLVKKQFVSCGKQFKDMILEM